MPAYMQFLFHFLPILRKEMFTYLFIYACVLESLSLLYLRIYFSQVKHFISEW